MKQKTYIALILAAALLAACLAGCGQKAEVKIVETAAPQETAAATAAPGTPAPVTTVTPDADRDARYRAAYETYAPDTVVLLVNDEPITWSEYFSWLYDIASQNEASYGITDWNDPLYETSTTTFGDYVNATVLDYVVQVAVIGQKAKEMGVELTEDERAELQATLDGYAEYCGGQEELEKLLSDSFLSWDYFCEQNEAMILINDIYVKTYGSHGANLPLEDAVAYLEDSGYLYAKHILFKTVDDNRQPLSDAEIAEKRAEAEAVLAELRSCKPEELDARFDSLMQQYSEDTGLLRYPDGYYFQAGEMVPVFEEAVRTLEENGLYPELVESEYGFHIIFRPAILAEHVMDYDSNGEPYGPKALASAVLFDNIMHEWFDEAKRNIKYVNGFENPDLNELLFG